MKIDNSGNEETLVGYLNPFQSFNGIEIQQNIDGSYIVVGESAGEIIVTKTDATDPFIFYDLSSSSI